MTAERRVCIRCGQEGHLSYQCKLKVPPQVLLPADRARCVPSQQCGQMLDCARGSCFHAPSRRGKQLIDASTALTGGGWCALFIDRRGVDLLGAAA